MYTIYYIVVKATTPSTPAVTIPNMVGRTVKWWLNGEENIKTKINGWTNDEKNIPKLRLKIVAHIWTALSRVDVLYTYTLGLINVIEENETSWILILVLMDGYKINEKIKRNCTHTHTHAVEHLHIKWISLAAEQQQLITEERREN